MTRMSSPHLKDVQVDARLPSDFLTNAVGILARVKKLKFQESKTAASAVSRKVSKKLKHLMTIKVNKAFREACELHSSVANKNKQTTVKKFVEKHEPHGLNYKVIRKHNKARFNYCCTKSLSRAILLKSEGFMKQRDVSIFDI